MQDEVKGPIPGGSASGTTARKEIWPGLSRPVGYRRMLSCEGSLMPFRAINAFNMLEELLIQFVTTNVGPLPVVIVIKELPVPKAYVPVNR